jgi:anti-anti-sigma factor
MHTIDRERIEIRRVTRRGRPPAIVSPQLLSATRTERLGYLTLHLCGQLDLTTVLTFRDMVFSAMGEGHEALILDLSEISILDNAGISALVTVNRVAELIGRGLRIIPSPRFESVLNDTGLNRQFNLTPARMAA